MEGVWRDCPLVLACVLALLLAAPAAHAVPLHIDGFIGGAMGIGSGGYFTEPSDVAVYGGGPGAGDDKIFVTEANGRRNSRVQRLDRHGNFELMWGRDVVRPGVRGDRGGGYEVCRRTVAGERGCQAAPAGAAAGELDTPTAIAVEDSSGRVYVMDRGNRRVQQFDLDGRFVRAWDWGGRIADSKTGAIAVDPSPPHDVFVGDEGNRRVLQFTHDGRFVRAWGFGVATGQRRFEVCVEAGGCRPGRSTSGPTFGQRETWPRHLAVDRDGIVYASESWGANSIVRFDGRARFAPPAAEGALLDPLPADRLLTDGGTSGMEIDPTNGDLVMVRNPFGPSVLERVRRPGAPLRSEDEEARPKAVVNESLPFLESVTGVGVGHVDGSVYVPLSSKLDPVQHSGVLNACPSPSGRRRCHGLMVLARGGAPQATIAGVASSGRSAVDVEGVIGGGGVVRQRVQVSRDGRSWRDAAAARYLATTGPAQVSVRATGLRPRTAYMVRWLVAKHTEGGPLDWTISNERSVIP